MNPRAQPTVEAGVNRKTLLASAEEASTATREGPKHFLAQAAHLHASIGVFLESSKGQSPSLSVDIEGSKAFDARLITSPGEYWSLSCKP
jgi:hypothetical protein